MSLKFCFRLLEWSEWSSGADYDDDDRVPTIQELRVEESIL